MLSLVSALCAVVAGALVTTHAPARRAMGISLGIVALVAPFAFRGDLPLVRFLAGAFGVLGLGRIIELSSETPPRPWPMRLWHAVGVVDTRTVERVPPSLDLRLALSGLSFHLLGTASLVTALVLHPAPATTTPLGLQVARWLLCTIFVYCVADGSDRLLRTAYLALGIRAQPTQSNPILSRSVAEFWGQRWNQVVGKFLRDQCYRPFVRRRRPRLGIAYAFAVSTLLHVYLTYAALTFEAALAMGLFFVGQGLFVLLEAKLRIVRWPTLLARAWTVTALLSTAPLFVQPTLDIAEGTFTSATSKIFAR